ADVRATACNEIWTVDFKGWWRTRDQQRCEPLTVRDAFSRYVLAITVLKSTSMPDVRRTFEALFKKQGVPEAIQCDNGVPFINVPVAGWPNSSFRMVGSSPPPSVDKLTGCQVGVGPQKVSGMS